MDSETLDLVLDIVTAVLLLLGGFLSLAAGIGLVRFPDAIARMHATTKPQILGLFAILLAVALQNGSWQVGLSLLPVLIFQMATAPISAHMVGRAGYRTGVMVRERILVDELEVAIAQAQDETQRQEAERARLDAGPHRDEHP